MPLQFAIPRRLVDKFLRKMTPLVGETVERFSENADHDGLTPKLKEWIERYQVAGWAEAYEDFNNFMLAHYAALPALGDSLPAIPQPDQIETLEDAQRWLDSVWEACEKVLDDDNDDWIDAITEGPSEPLGNFPTDDNGNQINRQALFLTVSVIISHNYFSCMVHRKSLFQLVAEAKAGDNESLLKAVQIDKRCLADIPYFRERILQAVRGGSAQLDRISGFLSEPSAG
jgi:hypothetical protein